MADDKSMADRIIEPLKKGGEQVRAAGEKLMESTSSVNLKVLDHAEKNAVEAFNAMRSYASKKTRGPIGEDVCIFSNLNGEPCDFEMFTFSNGYDLLTYGIFKGLHRKVVGFR